VIVALPAPTVVPTNGLDPGGIIYGLSPPGNVMTPISLVYTLNVGPNPPMMENVMGAPWNTAMVLGLTPREEVAGVTVMVAEAGAPVLSRTVIVTAVDAKTGFGLTVKVLPDTAALGTTAVLLEKAVPWYGVTPPEMMNFTWSLVSLVPVTETLVGVTARTLDAPEGSIVMVAVVVLNALSRTFRVTDVCWVATFAGNVTVMGVPLGPLPEVVWSQIPDAGVPLALKPFDGSLDVVT